MKTWLGAMSLLAVLGLAACDDDDGGTPDAPVGGGGEGPVFTTVRWERAGHCAPGQPSSYTVTTTATDPDTAPAMLAVSGAVTNCTPSPFTGSPATIHCPNLAPADGTVSVRDPQGNSGSARFMLDICADGMINP